MWTLYNRPADHPESAVARRWSVTAAEASPELLAIVASTVEPLRGLMRAAGMTCLPRSEHDDPVIVETWI